MRRNSTIAFLAVLLSGCASTQPVRVYVDAERVLASERPASFPAFAMPGPTGSAPAVVVQQPGLPATSAGDHTVDELETAKQLIAQNRSRSIETLSTMLERIYRERAEDENAKREKDAEPEDDAILASAVKRLKAVFEAYAAKRGPLVLRLNALAQNTGLLPVPVPADATVHAKLRLNEANGLRSQIRALDATYDTDANKILAGAQQEIETRADALRRQAEAARQEAQAKARSEAESQATATQTALNVQVTKLLPESLPAVAGRTVTIPGSPAPSTPSIPKNPPIFGSLDERRRLIDEQIVAFVVVKPKHLVREIADQ